MKPNETADCSLMLINLLDIEVKIVYLIKLQNLYFIFPISMMRKNENSADKRKETWRDFHFCNYTEAQNRRIFNTYSSLLNFFQRMIKIEDFRENPSR